MITSFTHVYDDSAERNSSQFHLSRGMGFPTMWYVRTSKPQISLRIRTV